MEAISRLGLDIDTRQLVRGSAEIDRFKARTDAAAASATKLERAQDSLNRQMSGMLATVGSLAAAVGGVYLLGAVIKYADGWKNAANQIRTAIKNVDDLKSAQQGVFDVAQRTYASYEATASLFARIGRGAADQIKSQQDLLRIVETVNKALAVGGASTGEREGAIIQLGQALGSGLLQGDELRSIRENASVLFKSIQGYVKDTYDVSGAAFKKFAADGKITTEIVLEAIRRSKTEVDSLFDKMDPTIGMGWTKVQNAIEKMVGKGGGPAFTAIAVALGAIADNLENIVAGATAAGIALAVAFGPSLIKGAVVAIAEIARSWDLQLQAINGVRQGSFVLLGSAQAEAMQRAYAATAAERQAAAIVEAARAQAVLSAEMLSAAKGRAATSLTAVADPSIDLASASTRTRIADLEIELAARREAVVLAKTQAAAVVDAARAEALLAAETLAAARARASTALVVPGSAATEAAQNYTKVQLATLAQEAAARAETLALTERETQAIIANAQAQAALTVETLATARARATAEATNYVDAAALHSKRELVALEQEGAAAAAALAAAQTRQAAAAAEVERTAVQTTRATGALAGVVGLLAGAFNALKGAAAGAMAWLLANPFAALAAAVVVAIGLLVAFSDKIVVARTKVEDLNDVGEKVTRDLSITLADRFGAIWDVLSSDMVKFGKSVVDFFAALGSQIGGALAGIGVWFAGLFGPEALNQVKGFIADVGKVFGDLPGYAAKAVNAVYAFFAGLQAATVKLFQTLPAVFEDVGIGMVNALIGALETGLNSAVTVLNDFIAKVNALLHGINAGFKIEYIDTVQLGRLKDDSAGAGAEVGKAFSDAYNKALENGGVVGRIGQAEQERALARARDQDKLANDLGGGALAADAGGAVSAKAIEKFHEVLSKSVNTWKAWLAEIADQAMKMEDEFNRLEYRAAISGQSFASESVAQLDRRIEILDEADQLLKSNAAMYDALGAGAQAAAVADAKRAIALKDAVQWSRQLKQTLQDSDRVGQLSSALAVSPDEYDTLKATFDLLDQFPDLTMDAARAEAVKQVAVSKTTQLLDRQAERARQLAEAPAENWLKGVEKASDDFWTNFANNGGKAFDNLGDAFKQIWKQLQADILRNQFEPWLKQIKDGIAGVTGGGGTTINVGNGGSAFSDAGQAFGGLFNLFGKKTPTTTGNGNPNAASDPSMSGTSLTGLQSAVAEAVNIAVASSVGSAVAKGFGVKNQENANIGAGIGTAVGAVIGSYIPYIGTYLGAAIGSFLGTWAGGSLGPSTTGNHGASIGISRNGSLSVGNNGEETGETSQSARTAADLIVKSQKTLEALGGTLSRYVDEIHIGNRDPSRFSLNGDDAMITTTKVGDPNALADAAMRAVLGGATFSNATMQGITDVMLNAGSSFQEILKVLGQIADVMPDTTKPLSAWASQLKALGETFDDMRESSAQSITQAAVEGRTITVPSKYGGFNTTLPATEATYNNESAAQAANTAAIDAVYAAALDGLKQKFNQSITDAIDEVNAPLKSRVKALFDSITTRIDDAKSLGADMTKVLELNALDIKGFVEQAGNSADAFAQLSAAMQVMRADALAAGQDVTALDAALAETKTSLRDAMDKSIGDAITQIESPLQAQIAALLKTQTDRIAAGTGLGADMTQIMRLNSDELKQFIANAAGSADAFAKLNDVFENLKAQAIAAGEDVTSMTAAFAAAKAQLATAFDDATTDAMLQIANPTLAALNAMLKTQQARVTQAQQIGANLVAVERLNAMETQKFFENLSSEQRNQLGDYLGLIQDFTGQVAITLQRLGDELTGQIDALDTRRQTLLDQAEKLRGFADGIDSTRQSLADKYSGLNPLASLEQLRSRFGDLANSARGGNESALQALPQVASQLTELSRSLYGSTSTFRADYDLVNRTLGEVSDSTKGAATLAESQAQTILEQRDILVDIRTALQSPDPALDFLQQQVGLLDDNNTLIAQLLQAYLNLEAAQSGQVLTDAALAAGATAAVTPAGTNPAAGGVQPAATTATENSSGDGALVNVAAEQLDVTAQGFKAMQESLDSLEKEVRRLSTVLLQQQAA